MSIRGGFAIIELPLLILFLVASAGLCLLGVTLFRHGTITGSAWLGLGLTGPFLAVLTWLFATHWMLGKQRSEADRES